MNDEICSRCGYPVSTKPKNSANAARRPDGGLDHVNCSPGSEKSIAARHAAKLDHRRAVRHKEWQGEKL